VNALSEIDYKDTRLIQRFTTSYAKIVPRRRSGTCLLHQRKLSQAIKRARFMALIPFVVQ
jgi:small subunit ribosomal protein S18